MSLYLKTEPTEEPITLSAAKGHLNVTIDMDDALIRSLITAARQQVESFLCRSLVTQTWELRLDCFPSSGNAVELPLPPVASVTSVSYVDSDGATQTWAAEEYQVDSKSAPGRLIPAYGYSYPSTRSQFDAVTITFVTGYGSGADVPQVIKQAMLLLIGEMYENREETVVGTIASKMPMTAERLLWPHRVIKA